MDFVSQPSLTPWWATKHRFQYFNMYPLLSSTFTSVVLGQHARCLQLPALDLLFITLIVTSMSLPHSASTLIASLHQMYLSLFSSGRQLLIFSAIKLNRFIVIFALLRLYRTSPTIRSNATSLMWFPGSSSLVSGTRDSSTSCCGLGLSFSQIAHRCCRSLMCLRETS